MDGFASVLEPSQGTGRGSMAGFESLLSKLNPGGGGRTSSASTASNVSNVSVNPFIYNQVGAGSPVLSPTIDGRATGSPSVGSTAQATGSEYLPSQFRQTPSYRGSPTVAYGPDGYPINANAGQDPTTLLVLGGAALALLWAFEG